MKTVFRLQIANFAFLPPFLKQVGATCAILIYLGPIHTPRAFVGSVASALRITPWIKPMNWTEVLANRSTEVRLEALFPLLSNSNFASKTFAPTFSAAAALKTTATCHTLAALARCHVLRRRRVVYCIEMLPMRSGTAEGRKRTKRVRTSFICGADDNSRRAISSSSFLLMKVQRKAKTVRTNMVAYVVLAVYFKYEIISNLQGCLEVT